MENLKKDTRMIGEFMGLDMNNVKDGYRSEACYYDDSVNVFYFLDYHKFWRLLMPVVAKINSIVQASEKAQEYFEQNKPYDYMMYVAGDVVVTSDISCVFPEVVEFVKWYNKNVKDGDAD